MIVVNHCLFSINIDLFKCIGAVIHYYYAALDCIPPTCTELQGSVIHRTRVSMKAPFVMLKLLPPLFLFHLVQSFIFFFEIFFNLFFYVG